MAQAAADSGVATRPIQDMDAYPTSLTASFYQTGILMRLVFNAARALPPKLSPLPKAGRKRAARRPGR